MAASAAKFYNETEPTAYNDCPVFCSQPVVVLCDSCTASAAESFIASMKYQNRTVIIGEKTFGSNGQPLMDTLPGGGRYAICTQICKLCDGTDYNNIGIKPDIFIQPTIDDFKKDYDRILDCGLITIRKLCAQAK